MGEAEGHSTNGQHTATLKTKQGQIMHLERRHFQFIAETIKDLRLYAWVSAIEEDDCRKDIANHFARALNSTNGQFQRDKFLRACGVNED